MPESEKDLRLAVLIDADNASRTAMKDVMAEVAVYGTPTIKRIYGDWTSPNMNSWKSILLETAITPIQQYSYTTGKNSTDSAMIIDAMDILYTNSVEGFCLVSSDSDFTRLASRIRESGLTVIGMGEKKTPTPFRKACDIFTTLELLIGEARRDKANGSSSSLTIEEVERAVVGIITDNQNNGKSTGLGEVGSRLLKRYPDFDVRSFGTNLLSKLLGEFKSVTIRKDGSNVRVELAEGVEHERAAAERPSDSEGVGEQAGEQAETASASEDSESEGGEDASSHSSKSRRRSRRRRKSSKVSGVEQGESADKKTNETIDGQREATSGTAESQTVSADQRGESGDSLAGEQEVASDETGVSQAEEAEAQVAVADEANRAGKDQEQAASDSSEDSKSQAPAKRRRSRSRKAPAAPTAPDDFIRAEVAASGKSGMAVAELSKRVRTRFKSFKVRELGYPHLAGYLADVEGVRVYKQGRENWVAKE